MTEDERLDRIEAILRANNLHEPDCAWITSQQVHANADGSVPAIYMIPQPCDCWLSANQQEG